MKKYFILISVILVFACNRQKDTGFEISVNLTGAEGKILLEKRGETGWIQADTAEIKNGTAIFRGVVEYPEDYYLSVLGERPKTILFVENSEIVMTGHVDSLETVLVTGSSTHDDYSNLNNQIRKIGDEYMELYQQARSAESSGDTATARQLMNKVQKLYAGVTTVQKDFIINNPGSYIIPFLLLRLQHNLEVEELDKLVSGLSPELSEVPSIGKLKEHIEKLKTLATGNIAPDFKMNDPEGNPVRFSDVYSKNKYTLLDFWAAWCGPCRAENPNIVAVYNDYKDKGFGVFGVSLDREKQAWLKAIEDDNLNWPQVSDLAYWNNAVAQMYMIRSIPSSLIVDSNGKIIAKNKRSDELRKTISGLLD